MKKRLKKRKIVLLFIFLLVLFCFFSKSKNYSINYKIDEIEINEQYNKDINNYIFEFITQEKKFVIKMESKYKRVKKLVKKVDIKETDDTICLIPEGDKLNFYPICIQNDKQISYHLVKEKNILPDIYFNEPKESKETYENISLYSLNNKKYFIWNYKGFYSISKDEKKNISLFTNDIYNIPLTLKVKENIIIADYNNKYEFDKFYVINSKTNKVKELKNEKEISFESYFLGTNEKKGYLIDKKNKIEYEIYPKRLLIHNITNNNQGKILVNGKWEPKGMNYLVNNEMNFSYKENLNYFLEENTLYEKIGDNKIKLSNKKVKEIVYCEKDTVYYLVEDKLYYFNPLQGEVLALQNFEWNFNYKNMIYIF